MAHKHFLIDEKAAPCLLLKERLLYTGVVRDDPAWFNVEHSHSFCEILYVVHGSGSVVIDHVNYTIGEGDLIAINPSIIHQEKSDPVDRLNLVFCAFDDLTLPGLDEGNILPVDFCPVIKTGAYQKKLEWLFLELINETSGRVAYYNEASKSLLDLIVVSILRMTMSFQKTNAPLTSECQKVKDYIDQNYTSNITLESLADTFYISQGHISHVFKNQMGVSPIRYLITKRVDEAARLLAGSALSINEIGVMTGHADPVYFSQVFKKVMGVSPSQYRKKHKR